MNDNYEAIVVGASAGAVEALTTVLSPLPPHFPMPIIVVVHLPPDRDSVMVELFSNKCSLRVKEAEDKEQITPGTIYFAPPDYHLLVEQNKTLSLSAEEPVMFSRPSIDVLFETAADAFDERLIGIILTGANSDGANGLRSIANNGGTALVQDPAAAYAAAMPAAALQACQQAKALSLKQISEFLQEVA